jgi:hypothetical protein
MPLYFTNISGKILLHFLGYSFCAECVILVHFCQGNLPLKAHKIICAKAVLVSISPTIYEQLLHHNPFAKKLQTQIVST